MAQDHRGFPHAADPVPKALIHQFVSAPLARQNPNTHLTIHPNYSLSIFFANISRVYGRGAEWDPRQVLVGGFTTVAPCPVPRPPVLGAHCQGAGSGRFVGKASGEARWRQPRVGKTHGPSDGGSS